MPPRAAPMSPEERRDHLVAVTIPLLYDHGRAVSTRLIAEAAGVAEGTIFRAFATKDDLVDAAVQRVLDPGPFLAAVAAVDADRPVRAVLTDLAELMQARFRRVFLLAAALGMVGPPGSDEAMREGRRRADAAMAALVRPHADRLRVTPEETVRLLRALVFAGTHPHLAEGHPLTTEQVVGTLLDGVLLREDA
jgi:AcrR family transcriptional regulator